MQLKNGRLEVLELVALFLLKTETCKAKNSSLMRVFRRMFLITQFLATEALGKNTHADMR